MAELERFSMLVGGKAVGALPGKTFQSQNPYTGEPWAEIPDGGPEDIDAAVSAARAALDGEWGATTGFARAALMRRLGDLITENAERLARLEVNDSGKLLREMLGQLNGLGSWYHYYAGLAATLEGRQIPAPNPNYLVYTRREPVGVVAAITPWNSPLLLMTWKLAPALAAGCTVVIKPSEHCPASTLGFAELIDQAGFPPGVVNVVTGLSREAGAALARTRRRQGGVHRLDGHRPLGGARGRGEPQPGHPGAGRQVPAGRVPGRRPARPRPTALVAGVFAATGQTCMAGSRLIVHAAVHDELVRLVAERAARSLGDPIDPATEMGRSRTSRNEKVLGYLKTAQGRAPTVAYGGSAEDRLGGYFVKPTVLSV